MAKIDVNIPDIGDFKDVPIIDIHVKVGDAVNAEDPLITLESDKATMDVPAPSAGTVSQILVKVGDRISEGAPIVLLDRRAGGEHELHLVLKHGARYWRLGGRQRV